MAEASAPTEINCPADPDNTGSVGSNKSDSFLECAVCLQPCVHPAQLPCGHIFCFLCVKGIANQSKKCAMCRQEIPRDFTEQPKLVEAPQATGIKGDTVDLTVDAEDEGYRWFYEGRNGWWQYDERTSKELEQSHKEGVQVCELLIAGFLYIVDLGNMVQARRNDPLRRRKIKRDLATIPKKGVAGLRSVESSSSSSTSTTPPVAVTTASTESSTQCQQTQTTRAQPQQAPVMADPCAQAAPPQPPPQASSRSARRRRSSGGSLNTTNGTTSISTTAGGIPAAPASNSHGPRTRSRSHRGSRGSNGDVTESNVSSVAMATACPQQQQVDQQEQNLDERLDALHLSVEGAGAAGSGVLGDH